MKIAAYKHTPRDHEAVIHQTAQIIAGEANRYDARRFLAYLQACLALQIATENLMSAVERLPDHLKPADRPQEAGRAMK